MTDQINSRIQWIENQYNGDNDIIPGAPRVTATEMAMLQIIKTLAAEVYRSEQPPAYIQQLPRGYNIEAQALEEWKTIRATREILDALRLKMDLHQAVLFDDNLATMDVLLKQVQDSINVRIIHGHGRD